MPRTTETRRDIVDRMLAAVGLSREKNCFITTLGNYGTPDNFARQIRLLRPAVILCMGREAAAALLKTNAPLETLRGRFHPYDSGDSLTIPLLATYSPGFLLKDESYKRPAWEDLKLLKLRLSELDTERPPQVEDAAGGA